MYKIFGVVYFSLFMVTLVKCYDLEEKPLNTEEDVEKISKQHKTKSTLKDDEVQPNIHNNVDLESKTGPTEESPGNVNEQPEEEFNKSERSGHPEEPSDDTTDTNFQMAQEDVPKTSFLGSYTRRLNTDEISDSIDNDSAKENFEIGRNENLADDTESEEVLMYTPNIKSLTRDIMLDVKARSGSAEFLDSDSGLKTASDEPEENVSKIDHFPPNNTNMRSGYIPPDYSDDIIKSSDVNPTDVNLLAKGPNSGFSYNLMPQSYQPYTARPEMTRQVNSLPRFSQVFFDSINSRELLYPNPNSRENIWGQGSGFGQQSNIVKTPYFGQLQPTRQIYNPRTRERCPFCQLGLVSSRERNFRRSAEEEPSKFETANGRSLDVEPIGANAYPLIPIEDKESEEALRIQDNLSHELFGTPSQVNRALQTPSQDNLKPLDHQDAPETNPFSQLIATFPPYYSRRTPMLSNQRFGLGGIHRIFG